MMKFLMMLFALLREFKSVTITIKVTALLQQGGSSH